MKNTRIVWFLQSTKEKGAAQRTPRDLQRVSSTQQSTDQFILV